MKIGFEVVFFTQMPFLATLAQVPAFLPGGEPGHGPLWAGLERLLPQRLQPPPALGLGEGTLQDSVLKSQGYCSVYCALCRGQYTVQCTLQCSVTFCTATVQCSILCIAVSGAVQYTLQCHILHAYSVVYSAV